MGLGEGSHLHGPVVVLWDGLRLQVALQGAIEVVLQEPFQSFPVRTVKRTAEPGSGTTALNTFPR